MSDQAPELWWSPSMGQFLTRHENSGDEHLVWIVQMNHESLRHHLGTGPDSNPPLPADAVKLGDAEALRRQHDDDMQNLAQEAHRSNRLLHERNSAAGERDALRAEIRDRTAGIDLDEVEHFQDGGDCIDACPGCALADVRALVERETPREEPEEGSPSAIAAEELAALTRTKAGAATAKLDLIDSVLAKGLAAANRVPLTLLGWTVPDHIEFEITGKRSWTRCITCDVHFRDDTDYPNASSAAGAFVTRHAHGHVVEHQPAQDSEDI